MMAERYRQKESLREVAVTSGPVVLAGNLEVPVGATGIVLFAHGSGSGRFSPRNQFVAGELRKGKLGTLLIDLLTREEEDVDRFTMRHRFDIDLLTDRLMGATDWLLGHPPTKDLAVGYFGASTGAAAVLYAAARRPEAVRAVVSRGGRPDLARPALPHVQAPTLLIVGGDDTEVLALNRLALAELPAEKKLEIVPGATHLFEEPGALEEVARLAREWFQGHLFPSPGSRTHE
jgi:putative phosphoribosyl transferase